MNIEKNVKIAMAAFFATSSAVFLTDFFYFKKESPLNLFFAAVGAVFLVLFEVYIRIQHNIDNKFTGIGKEFEKAEDMQKHFLDSHLMLEREEAEKMNRMAAENAERFFIMKNEFDFKLLNLKDVVEKKLQEIRQKQSELGEFLTNLQADIKKSETVVFDALNSLHGRTGIYVAEEVKKSLLQLAPDLFSYRSVLYIGVNPIRSLFLEEFIKAGFRTTVLEIFEPNVDFLRNLNLVDEVIEGDIVDFDFKNSFDVIFWWHGPEHIGESLLEPILKKMENFAKVVAIGCPWGKYEQGEKYGNPYEKHLSQYREGYFEKLGYKVNYFGIRDIRDSNICAVKYNNNAAS